MEKIFESRLKISIQFYSVQFSSVQFSRSVVSNSVRSRESQHARLPCPSPTPGVHSDSLPEPGIEARSPTLQADILPSEQLGKPKEMGISDHLTFLLRNLYAGQEATVKTRNGTIDWSQIGKGVCQGCILSACLFNLYAEHIMQNTQLDEEQAEIRLLGQISVTSDMMTPL